MGLVSFSMAAWDFMASSYSIKGCMCVRLQLCAAKLWFWGSLRKKQKVKNSLRKSWRDLYDPRNTKQRWERVRKGG